MKSALLLMSAALLPGLAALACQPRVGKAPSTTGEQREHHPRPLFIKVTAAAFSPDNKYVLVGYSDGTELLTLSEVATGKMLHCFCGPLDCVTGVAFVSAGKRVLSASLNGRLLLYDLPTGKLVRDLRAYEQSFDLLAASPDGRLALTAGSDKEDSVARLWDTAGPRLLRTFGGPDLNAWGLALSPDGKWALTGCQPAVRGGLVQLWDLATGRVRFALPPDEGWSGDGLAFSPDSRLGLISQLRHVGTAAKWRLGVWEVATGKLRCRLEGEAGLPAAFTANGKAVVGVTYGGKPKVRMTFWDLSSGKVAKNAEFPSPEKNNPEAFFLSADGKLALVGSGCVSENWSKDQPREDTLQVAVWDLAAGRVLSQLKGPPGDR